MCFTFRAVFLSYVKITGPGYMEYCTNITLTWDSWDSDCRGGKDGTAELEKANSDHSAESYFFKDFPPYSFGFPLNFYL